MGSLTIKSLIANELYNTGTGEDTLGIRWIIHRGLGAIDRNGHILPPIQKGDDIDITADTTSRIQFEKWFMLFIMVVHRDNTRIIVGAKMIHTQSSKGSQIQQLNFREAPISPKWDYTITVELEDAKMVAEVDVNGPF